MRRPVSAGCDKLPRIDALEGAKKRSTKFISTAVSSPTIAGGSLSGNDAYIEPKLSDF
jgi:hypothetical protein